MPTRLLIVELDDPKRPAGPATVVGHTETIAGYRSFRADRDGCRSERLRLWRDIRGGASVGARVVLPAVGAPEEVGPRAT
jgi:hypothetical protein